jgi:hypothetical protein
MQFDVLKGITGILSSRKGTAFLLTLGISSFALLAGKLSGISYSAVIATIFSIWTVSHATQESLLQGKNNESTK